MAIMVGDNKLVTYVVPDEESYREMEQRSSNSWRIFDGAKWKFQIEDRETALKYCKRMGGTHIGFAVWDDVLEANVYKNVQRVRVR